MDISIFCLLLLLPISLFISVDRDLTLPKVHGLLLSTALFYVIVNAVRRKNRLQIAAIALILLSLAVVFLGLFGTDWNDSRFQFLDMIYQILPNIITNITNSPAGAGINANTLGGALAFFLPFLVSLFWDKGGFNRMFLKNASREELETYSV